MNLFILIYIVGFIRTLVIIVLIYFAIRLFTRYVLPLILDKKIKDMHQKMEEQKRRQNHSNRSDGDVTIEYDKKRNKKSYDDDGEYVDFEEVE